MNESTIWPLPVFAAPAGPRIAQRLFIPCGNMFPLAPVKAFAASHMWQVKQPLVL